MTPEQLRDVAWALDKLSDLARCLLEPYAAMESMNAATAEVTVSLERDTGPMSQEDARKLLAWVNSTEMQDDLRAMADQIEAATS